MNINVWKSKKPHATRVGRGVTLVVDQNGRRFFRARAARSEFRINTEFASQDDYQKDLERMRLAEDCLRHGLPFPWVVGSNPEAAKPTGPTFREVATEIVAKIVQEQTNAKNQKQWTSTLEAYVFPMIGDLTFDEIGIEQARRIFEGNDNLWVTRTVTGSKLRQRLQRIWAVGMTRRLHDDPKAARLPNPFEYRGCLDAYLADPAKLTAKKSKRQPSLDWRQAPDFYRRWSETVKGRIRDALRLQMLTALRPGNVANLQIEWLDGDVIRFPAPEMKTKKPFLLPLSRHAQEIIKAQKPVGGLLFGSQRGKPLSTDASQRRMQELTKQWGFRPVDGVDDHCVPHGNRATFATWARENAVADGDLIELCLAHSLPGVRGAYHRGPVLEARRELAKKWADFLTGEAT